MKKSDRRQQAALAVFSAICTSAPALASEPQFQVGTQSNGPPAAVSAGMVVFAHMAPNSPQIGILAESAHIKVVRDANAADISIASNCPRDWSLKGSIIRQAGFTTPRHGVAMMADALGQRAILNGKIYPLAEGASGLQMGPKGVIVNGQPVEPLQGSDVPGITDQPDAIEVIVPDSYTGSLMLGMTSDSKADVNSWKNGDFRCTLLGNATLQAGSLSSLSKAAVDLKGSSAPGPTVRIEDVSTKVLVGNVSGRGNIDIEHGSADITNATVSGDGHITMKGRFDHLEQAVEGTGSIKVN